METIPNDPSFGSDKGSTPRSYDLENPGFVPGQNENQPSNLLRNKEFAANPTGGPKPEDEARQKLESQIGATQMARETAFENWATKGKEPGIVVEGLRNLYIIETDSDVAEEVKDPWSIKRVHSEIYDRGLRMKMPVEDLKNRGWIKNYNPETGLAEVIDRNAAAFAISIEEKPEWRVTEKETVKVGDQIQTIERQTLQIGYEYNFGKKYTDEKGNLRDERKEMARICERLHLEMSVKGIEGSIFGAIIAYRDSVENLSEILQRFKFTVPHLQTLFNLPDKDAVKENIEDYTEGLRVEKATWWFLGMMASEKKSTMKDFIERPATKALIMPGAPDAERTRFLKTMFGDWDSWAEDNVRTKDTLLTEGNIRGPIAKWGNIPARGRGEYNDFSYDEEMNYIKLIGELVGSEPAVWSAAAHLHAFQEFAMNGVVRFADGSLCLELGTPIFLKGNDLGKNNVDEFIIKERNKGRPSGPKDIVGKMPKLGLSFFDHAQIIMGRNREGRPITLPLRTAWLGENAKTVTDIVTGERNNLDAVPYHRLGSLDYGTLARDDFGANKLLIWLADRDKNGILPAALNGEPDPEVFGEKSLKGFRKYFGIVENALTANKGDMRGQSRPDKSAEKIAFQAVSDLLDAYENTPSYEIGMVKNIKVYAPDPLKVAFGDTENTKEIGLPGLYHKLRDSLGFSKGKVFDAQNQFIEADKVKNISPVNLTNKK